MKFLNLTKAMRPCYYAFFAFLAIFSTHPLYAQPKMAEKITIKVMKQPVEQIFKEISKQTGVKFFYGEEIVNNKITVDLNVQEELIDQVLEAITHQTHLYFSRDDNTISVSKTKKITTTVRC